MDGDFRLGPWLVRPSLNTIARDGQSCHLEPKVMEVLVCLAQRSGNVVSKERLIADVWSGAFVGDEVLTRCISELRRALQDDAKAPHYIQTISKRGYRLLVPAMSEFSTPLRRKVATRSPEASQEPSNWALRGVLLATQWRIAERRTAKRLVLGGLILVTAGFLTGYLLVRIIPPAPATQFQIDPPAGQSFDRFAIPALSPDGSKIAVVAATADSRTLWLRQIKFLEFEKLPGTEGVEPVDQLTWSADSRYLYFVAGGKIKRVDTRGGLPETLCDARDMAVGALAADGTVLLAASFVRSLGSSPRPIQQLNPENCSMWPVTRLDPSRYDLGHQWPRLLPDGKHFLYAGLRTDRHQDVLLGSLLSETSTVLVRNASDARYVEPGYLFFERSGYLFAQRFSTSELRLVGEPVQVVRQQLSFGGLGGKANYDVSGGGVLVYREQQLEEAKLLIVDSWGKQLEVIERPGLWEGVRATADGSRVVAGKTNPQTHASDLWTYDRQTRTWERASFDLSTGGHFGVWSPDGKTIIYAALSKQTHDLYRTTADAPRQKEAVGEPGLDRLPNDFSPDGRFLIYTQWSSTSQSDLWGMALTGEGKPYPLVQTQADEGSGRFSPDGRWIAYVSDESGRYEIYVRSFPEPGRVWRISLDGGRSPSWNRDGRKLYYLTLEGKLMEVPIRTGTSVRAGRTRFLFSVPGEESDYEVLGEGKFLINQLANPSAGPITVLLNWTAVVDPKVKN